MSSLYIHQMSLPEFVLLLSLRILTVLRIILLDVSLGLRTSVDCLLSSQYWGLTDIVRRRNAAKWSAGAVCQPLKGTMNSFYLPCFLSSDSIAQDASYTRTSGCFQRRTKPGILDVASRGKLNLLCFRVPCYANLECYLGTCCIHCRSSPRLTSCR